MDKKFKVFVIIALVVLAVLAAAGTVITLNIVNSTKAEEVVEEVVEKQDIQVIALDEAITANLAGDERSRAIIRTSIGFGVDGKAKTFKEFTEKFTEKQLIIRDEIIRILRAQTYEMMTRKDAQDKLEEEIKNRINEVLLTQIIQEVYFAEFVVQ